jgi:ribosomal-protein-alanine N-acetyltransferase
MTSRAQSTGRPMGQGGAEIQPARPADAPLIYALMCQVFGGSFLPYTIYQSPKSQAYLARLISEAGPGSDHTLNVLKQAGSLAGYYHAVLHGKTFFLNYIAVAPAAQGRGLGDRLLADFEVHGRSAGCRQLSLDVFESNAGACAWYTRRGYQLQRTTYSLRLPIAALALHPAPPLAFSDEAWAAAVAQERDQGFSRLDCSCDGGRVSLGLISGTVAKVLDLSDVPLEVVVPSVAAQLRGQREHLILTALASLPEGWPILAADRSLRLVKPSF